MGEVGIPRHEFLYELKLWEINAIIRGYRRRNRELLDMQRWQTWCIATLMGAKIATPRELRPFPWDREEETPLNQEEADEMLELMNNINSRKEEDDES